ncbi:monooxygenase [Wenjunlia vitaminophila]|uniref:Monooxygenase n=1 Tax=Wenjunlia vitaminophila TaxID=76728 RepID=A0A0T6LU98_WENVI|nr:FAD-dependent monooxygenase [Wenjunlia vitaminophila]KRV49572.1 monooxygenase [Wenjunlia vitaminophila]
MDNFDADVVISGAGPTGLMLAGELRLQGISVIVVERLAEPVQESRALGFSARTIEEFDQRGLLSRFGEVNLIPFGHFGGVSLDYRVIPGGSYGARGIPQAVTEAMLAGWTGELGADVRRGWEVTGLTTDDDGVTVEVDTPDGPSRLRAAYVVGCDGGRSAVRKAAGIEFTGTEPRIELRYADIAGVQLPPGFSGRRVEGGMVIVLPLGPDRCRVSYYEAAEPLRKGPGPITFEEVVGAWKRLTGEDISHGTPLWVSSSTDASRQATEYRRGRVLVAGDAAHLHLPIGAQGMSAGIQDAVNLGWKLALTIKGQAPEGLLDTYHSERHPVGARILTNTLAQSQLYVGGDEIKPLLEVFTELTAYEDVQRHLVGMVTGLDIRHDMGPGDHPLLGRRLEEQEVVVEGEKKTTFELLHPGRAVLLDLGDDAELRETAAGWSDRVTTVSGDCEGLPRGLLVRPDGYVAWVSPEDARTEGLADALTRWFGPSN